MSKRKILTLAMALCMVAILAIGGTLAYFTDTDEATNVFTVGNVQIQLIEQQSNGTSLEAFQNNQKLYPIVGSAQGEKDVMGQPVAENYIDKIVTVKNTGSEDAYIRAYFAIPSALDDGYDTFNAGLNVLHFNYGNYGNNGDATTFGVEWNWKNESGTWQYFETTIGEIKYNVYYADYTSVVKPGETTKQFISGVYLDKSFNYDGTNYTCFGEKLTLDAAWNWNNVSCPVATIAVQAAGFDTADAAFNEAFGADFNPFGGAVTNLQK